MAALKKRNVKVSKSGPSRPRAEAARRYYLVSTVTAKEKQAITAYCKLRGMSLSAFLADLILKDARNPVKDQGSEDAELTVTLRLSRDDLEKLRIFSRLQQKSIPELLKQELEPRLRKRQTASTVALETIRCWLSPSEHKAIMKYLDKRHLSARAYLAQLALNAIGYR